MAYRIKSNISIIFVSYSVSMQNEKKSNASKYKSIAN